jgi:hypothetical protein
MARAYGSNAHMLTTRETVYAKRPPATTSDMPFNHCNLGDEQGLIDDPVLGQGRDETIRDDGLIEGSRRRQSSC